MDTAQIVATVLGAGGGGAALLALINGLFKWLSGASGRERIRNTDANTQRAKAEERREEAETDRDKADQRRRRAYEYASILRQQLLENGITPQPWPEDRNWSSKTSTGETPIQKGEK